MAGTRKKGRPTKYATSLVEKICDRLAGGESLTTICEDACMPSRSTVFRWLANDEHSEFPAMYRRAREQQADAIFDEIAGVEAEVRRGDIDANTARVLIDAKKWRAGKLRPSVYSDQLRHVGHDGGPV